MATRHVLSIDGGGVRGIVAAAVVDRLAAFRRAEGRPEPLGDGFDLIAGAGAGAALAAALAAPDLLPEDGAEAETFAALFGDGAVSGRSKRLGARFAAKARPDVVAAAAAGALGDSALGATRRNLLVPAYSLDPRMTVLFRGGPAYAGSEVESVYGAVSVADAVRASAAAPLVAQPVRVENPQTGERWLCIGAEAFAGDPALAAYAEARRVYPFDEIRLVSLGGGALEDAGFKGARGWPAARWSQAKGRRRPPVVSMMADAQARAVEAQLSTLLGAHYIRLDCDLPPGESARSLKRLQRSAADLAEDMRAEIESVARLLP